MRTFKPTYKDKLTGEVKDCGHWYITFKDKHQVRRRLPAFTDKDASDRARMKIQELLAPGCTLTDEIQKWIEAIPPKMRERLTAWGVIDSQRISSHLGKTLADHVRDFGAGLKAKGSGARYARLTAARLCDIFAKCGFKMWNDLEAHRLLTYLASLRGSTGIGERTFNSYLKAAKHFAKWMIEERRAASNPIEYLKCMAQTERRRERRALDLDEQRRLLATTAAGPEHHGLTGRERSLIYQLALETGLRAGEIRHLKVSSFDFKAHVVSLPSAYTKNKKVAEIDLKPSTGAALQSFLAGKPADAPAFAFTAHNQPALMIKADLEAAGIPRNVDGRWMDFHGLRHSFITNLARAGVHPRDAQELARHSDINLTMKHYTHPRRAALKEIMQDQPDLTAPENLSQACPGSRSA